MTALSLRAADHVRGKSDFVRYRAGLLWYRTDDAGLEFPVPVGDVEGAELLVRERSAALLKWIRKHLETIKQGAEVTETTA